MKKKNIVLIAIYDPDSLGVRTLHAALKAKGFSVHSIFLLRPNPNNTMTYPTDADINALVDLVSRLDPLFVGVSVRSTFFKLAVRISGEIRKNSDAPILWGGIHASIRPEQCVGIADMVCMGEGEETVTELAEKLSRGEAFDHIKNLWIRKQDGIINNDIRPLIQDMDTIPFADFSGENKYFVTDGHIHESFSQNDRSGYHIMTSRGCLFACNYCCNQSLREIYKGKGKYVRRRSVENVMAELVQAKQTFRHLKMIYFFDDIFTFDAKWIRKFCEHYKTLIGLPFFCYYHPAIITEEVVRLLKDAGVEIMTAGIQSGSERITHNYFNRHVGNSKIIRAARLLKKYDIDCTYDLILDNPLETGKDKRETLNLLLRMPRPFEVFHVTLTHFPETRLTKILSEKGMISESDIEDEKQKGYERWSLTLDTNRDRENLFWENLYFLANKRYVPKWLVRVLSHMRFLRNHPDILTQILRKISPWLRTGTVSESLVSLSASQLEILQTKEENLRKSFKSAN